MITFPWRKEKEPWTFNLVQRIYPPYNDSFSLNLQFHSQPRYVRMQLWSRLLVSHHSTVYSQTSYSSRMRLHVQTKSVVRAVSSNFTVMVKDSSFFCCKAGRVSLTHTYNRSSNIQLFLISLRPCLTASIFQYVQRIAFFFYFIISFPAHTIIYYRCTVVVKIDEQCKIRIVNNNKDIHLPFFPLLYTHPFFSFHFRSFFFLFFFWLFVYSRESVTRDWLLGTVPILDPWGLDGNLNTTTRQRDKEMEKARDYKKKRKRGIRACHHVMWK